MATRPSSHAPPPDRGSVEADLDDAGGGTRATGPEARGERGRVLAHRRLQRRRLLDRDHAAGANLDIPEHSSTAAKSPTRSGTSGKSCFAYAISFAVIGRFWLVHHRFFSEVIAFDGRLIALNMVYLGFLVLIPFSSEVLGEYGGVVRGGRPLLGQPRRRRSDRAVDELPTPAAPGSPRSMRSPPRKLDPRRLHRRRLPALDPVRLHRPGIAPFSGSPSSSTGPRGLGDRSGVGVSRVDEGDVAWPGRAQLTAMPSPVFTAWQR